MDPKNVKTMLMKLQLYFSSITSLAQVNFSLLSLRSLYGDLGIYTFLENEALNCHSNQNFREFMCFCIA